MWLLFIFPIVVKCQFGLVWVKIMKWSCLMPDLLCVSKI